MTTSDCDTVAVIVDLTTVATSILSKETSPEDTGTMRQLECEGKLEQLVLVVHHVREPAHAIPHAIKLPFTHCDKSATAVAGVLPCCRPGTTYRPATVMVSTVASSTKTATPCGPSRSSAGPVRPIGPVPNSSTTGARQ